MAYLLARWLFPTNSTELSVELVYKSGEFVQAITRGDGITGEAVTHTIEKAKGFLVVF